MGRGVEGEMRGGNREDEVIPHFQNPGYAPAFTGCALNDEILQ